MGKSTPIVSSARYDAVAKSLHWLTAAMVIGLLGVGLWMTGLRTSPFKIDVYAWHKWFGLTVLALTALRVAWRATHPPPALLAASRLQRRIARSVHGVMYALLLAMPMTGWLQNSAAGFPLSWFGLFRVPPLIERDREALAAIAVVFAAMLSLLPLSAVDAAPLRFDASNSTLVSTGSYEGPQSKFGIAATSGR